MSVRVSSKDLSNLAETQRAAWKNAARVQLEAGDFTSDTEVIHPNTHLRTATRIQQPESVHTSQFCKAHSLLACPPLTPPPP